MNSLRERQEALLADLLAERAEATEVWWQVRLDQKIGDMREAINGSAKTAGDSGVQDVPRSDAQTL